MLTFDYSWFDNFGNRSIQSIYTKTQIEMLLSFTSSNINVMNESVIIIQHNMFYCKVGRSAE